MAAIPCVCNNEECRTIYFSAGINAVGPEKPGIMDVPMGGGIGIGTCPNCGSKGYIPAGRYALDFKDNDTNNPARLLAGPLSTKIIIEQAYVLMEALRQTKQEQQNVIAALETVSPAIAEISRKTLDTINYKEWANLIIALLGLLIAIQQGFFKKDDSSDIKREYIDHLLKENTDFKEKQVAQVALKKVTRPVKTSRPKAVDQTGRNQLCPCGSGKKFKRCHGA